MTVNKITNLEKFFEAVNKCEGKVELITEQGDRYNLKATLSHVSNSHLPYCPYPNPSAISSSISHYHI